MHMNSSVRCCCVLLSCLVSVVAPPRGMWQELRSETLRTARNFDRFDVSAARSFLNEPSNTSPAPTSPPAPPRGSNPSRRTPGTYYTDGHLSTKFGTDWLAHSRDDNPYSCGSRCETTMLPYVNPPKYAGSVDLTLNYRTEKDDRLYTSDEGRAERADRFTNSHYYRSYYYFSFNRSSGLWMDREYTITWYDESKSEYDPTNSLPHDQILYGNQPQIVQNSYLDGHHGGNVESPDVQHKTTLGVLELTPMEFSKSGALVVKVPPGMDHETRVRFKIFAGGHRMNGGGGYGAYLMPRAEWDDLFFKGIAFNWHGRNEHVPNTQGYGVSVKTHPLNKAGISVRVKSKSRDSPQYSYTPVSIRYDYRYGAVHLQRDATTLLRRPGNPMCRPEADPNPETGQLDCECRDFSEVKESWGLGRLPCCSNQYPRPDGQRGTPWCYCERLHNNDLWRPCSANNTEYRPTGAFASVPGYNTHVLEPGPFRETLSWSYVEIKVNKTRMSVTHANRLIFDQEIQGDIFEVGTDWVFLIGASTETDMSDIHVMDEVEIAHWHPKVVSLPPDTVRLDKAITTVANISWIPNPDDGGSPVTEYILSGSYFILKDQVSGALEDVRCPAREGSRPDGYPLDRCMITNLTRGTRYTFTFQALNGVGLGPKSEENGRSKLVFETPVDYSGHPQNFRVVNFTSTTADLAWDYPEDDGGAEVESYKIFTYTIDEDGQRCLDPNGPYGEKSPKCVPPGPYWNLTMRDNLYIERDSSGSVRLNGTVRGLYRNSRYYFTIAAANYRGYRGCPPHIKCISPNTTIIHTPPQVPHAPTMLSLSQVPFYDFKRRRVDFVPSIEDGGRPVIGYKFYVQQGDCKTDHCRNFYGQSIIDYGFGPLCRLPGMALDDPFRNKCIKDTYLNPGPLDHYQVFDGLVRGTWHYFWVSAVNAVGESPMSAQWMGVQTPDVPEVYVVSLMAKASQSSTLVGSANCRTPTSFNRSIHSGDQVVCSSAQLAIDDLDGFKFNHWLTGSISATNLEPYPWWEMDMTLMTTVFFFRVWRRTDCCEIPKNIRFSIHDSYNRRNAPVWSYLTTDRDRDTLYSNFLELWPRANGVRLRVEALWPFFLLSMAELRVFGWRKGCPEEFQCMTPQGRCDALTRLCVCAPGYSGMTCEVEPIVGATLTRLQCTNFTYVSLKLNLTQAALGNWTRCTMPSKAICEQFDECQPEEEGLPPFPTLLRMLEMLFISVMAGVLFGLIMSCCMISFWLTSEVNSEISMTEDERDEKLKQIRRRMQFADIAKVVPMEDSGIPNNLKLPPIRRPKDLPKKVKLHGSVAAGIRKTAKDTGQAYRIGRYVEPSIESDGSDIRTLCGSEGFWLVLKERRKFLAVVSALVIFTVFIVQIFAYILAGSCVTILGGTGC